MSNRTVLMSVWLTMMVSLAALTASTANVVIDTSGTTPFVYEGRSYVPLKSTASFLGAPLRWDAEKGQAVITYEDQDLALTPNSRKALHAGRPVVLPSPPVVVDGVTYVPAEAFTKFFNVPVEWDRSTSEVKIKGPSGWGTMKANSRPSWHGGPPPWAPAWGRRGYGTPGHSSSVKPGASGKAKGLEQPWYREPGHPSKEKPKAGEKARGPKKGK